MHRRSSISEGARREDRDRAVTIYNAVLIFDGTTNAQIGSIPISLGVAGPIGVNSVTNKIYVPTNTSITVIDGVTNTPTPIPTPGRNSPFSILVNSITNKIYVADYDASQVTVIDGATNNIAVLNVAGTPYRMSIDPVTNKIYVGCKRDKVSVIDGLTNKVTNYSTPAGGNINGIATSLVTNKTYAMTSSSPNTIQLLTDSNTQDVLLDTAIAPDTMDPLIVPQPTNVLVTYNTQPNFALVATSRFPAPVQPTSMFYQVDTWQGNWTRGLLTSSVAGSGQRVTTRSRRPRWLWANIFCTRTHRMPPPRPHRASTTQTASATLSRITSSYCRTRR